LLTSGFYGSFQSDDFPRAVYKIHQRSPHTTEPSASSSFLETMKLYPPLEAILQASVYVKIIMYFYAELLPPNYKLKNELQVLIDIELYE